MHLFIMITAQKKSVVSDLLLNNFKIISSIIFGLIRNISIYNFSFGAAYKSRNY